MKKLLFILLTIIPCLAWAGKITVSGNWKEVKRMKTDKSQVAFTDTIHINFLTGGEYVWQKAGSFIYKGTYKVADNNLDMGSRSFTIVDKKGNHMTLQDDEAIYEFETYTPTTQNSVLAKEEAPKAVKDLQQMIGHWSVYKRTSAKTLSTVDYTHVLKMIDIRGTTADGGELGYLFATRDADTAPSWYVDRYQNQTLYCDGKDKRTFKVIKCQDNELVLEEDGMTYFFKQFKQ